MSFLEWKAEYSVKNATIDYDHQMLVNIINQLDHAITAKQGKRVIGQTIESLMKYVENHFAREEKLMRDADYPELQSHKSVHREIEQTVRDIYSLYQRSPKELDAEEVLRFLKTWLVGHILKADMKYAPYLQNLNTGMGARL